jgi:hypothetical protein
LSVAVSLVGTGYYITRCSLGHTASSAHAALLAIALSGTIDVRQEIQGKGPSSMRRGDNRLTGAQLSASLYFHKPPGIGWRLHISKIAAEIRVAPSPGISKRLRNGNVAPK